MGCNHRGYKLRTYPTTQMTAVGTISLGIQTAWPKVLRSKGIFFILLQAHIAANQMGSNLFIWLKMIYSILKKTAASTTFLGLQSKIASATAKQQQLLLLPLPPPQVLLRLPQHQELPPQQKVLPLPAQQLQKQPLVRWYPLKQQLQKQPLVRWYPLKLPLISQCYMTNLLCSFLSLRMVSPSAKMKARPRVGCRSTISKAHLMNAVARMRRIMMTA
mmetsp:Transcript_8007/g.12127  ORF Transcript_8007/g.12127 Transcript_8007/m.12127 type:complete len:217 (+) Transcript_8007:2599-3249(+)